MNTGNQYLIALFLVLLGFVAGYLVGRVDLVICKLAQNPVSGGGFKFNRQPDNTSKIKTAVNIDESTFVTTINTDGFSKTSETALGKVTEKPDDIQASVSRLAQLKGK
jgi:hypothetical protein